MFHFKAIIHILGTLLLLNGVFMATILPVSWHTNSTDFNALLYSSVISFNLGIVIWWLTRKVKKELSSKMFKGSNVKFSNDKIAFNASSTNSTAKVVPIFIEMNHQ